MDCYSYFCLCCSQLSQLANSSNLGLWVAVIQCNHSSEVSVVRISLDTWISPPLIHYNYQLLCSCVRRLFDSMAIYKLLMIICEWWPSGKPFCLGTTCVLLRAPCTSSGTTYVLLKAPSNLQRCLAKHLYFLNSEGKGNLLDFLEHFILSLF